MPIAVCILVLGLLFLPRTTARAAEEALDVTSFGAVPNDGTDDTQAIRKALAAASGQANAHVVFPPGRYDCFADASKQSFVLTGCRGLFIEGAGSELMFHGDTAPFAFYDCKDVTVKGFVIDYGRPPFSVAEVASVNEDGFDTRVWDEFPVSGGEPIASYSDYDPVTHQPMRGGNHVYDGVARTELIGPQRLRVFLKPNYAAWAERIPKEPGDLLILRHRTYRFPGFCFNGCTDIVMNGVTIYTVPGMAYRFYECHNAALESCRIEPRPGTRRIMSATADATHFVLCTGLIRMDNCVFVGMGDDGGNIHGEYLTVLSKVDAHTVTAQFTYMDGDTVLTGGLPRHNDIMSFTSKDTLLPYGDGIVAEAIPIDGKRQRIAFLDPLPARVRVGDYVTNTTRVPKVRIRNCTVGSNRGRGFLIQARDVVVENCTFRDCSAAGIHATCDVNFWRCSIGTRDVVIRNNLFERCNNGVCAERAVIDVFAHLKGGRSAALGVHRDIVIEGNHIRDTDQSAIFVGSTDGAKVIGNTIIRCTRRPKDAAAHSAISLCNSRDVHISDNILRSSRNTDGTGDQILIGEGCESQTIRLEDNQGF